MRTTSRFNLEQATIDDFTLIENGTIVCHKDKLIFHFQCFVIKLVFLIDKKQANGVFELDSKATPATLKCYNFGNYILV